MADFQKVGYNLEEKDATISNGIDLNKPEYARIFGISFDFVPDIRTLNTVSAHAMIIFFILNLFLLFLLIRFFQVDMF